MSKKKLTGIIVSDKMQKTVVVKIERIKEHPKYKKRYKVHSHIKAHDENKEFHIGDKVVMEECPPISKDKHFKVIGKV